MAPLGRALYRTLLHSVKRFEREGIPLTGVIRTRLVTDRVEPAAILRQAFNQRWVVDEDATLRDSSHVLDSLHQQLRLLTRCERPTRRALRCWQAFLSHDAPRSNGGPGQQALAAERALLLAEALTRVPDTVLEDEALEQALALKVDLEGCVAALDDLAAQVARSAPHLFPAAVAAAEAAAATGFGTAAADASQQQQHRADSPGLAAATAAAAVDESGGSPAGVAGAGRGVEATAGVEAAVEGCEVDVQALMRLVPWGRMLTQQGSGPAAAQQQQEGGEEVVPWDTRKEQFEALTQVLFQQLKYRPEPFEWVYDGLAPFRLHSVVQSCKGMEFVLAVMAAGVGARLGLHLSLWPANTAQRSIEQGPAMAAAERDNPLYNAVVARQAGRASTSAPDQEYWLLRLDPPSSPLAQGGSSRGEWRVEEGEGPLFFRPSRRGGQHMTAEQALKVFPNLEADAAWSPRMLLRVVAECCHVVMTAHQRRGESDLVAHWLYQVLATDPAAPEWEQALQPEQIARLS